MARPRRVEVEVVEFRAREDSLAFTVLATLGYLLAIAFALAVAVIA